jgi:hypothetical protein
MIMKRAHTRWTRTPTRAKRRSVRRRKRTPRVDAAVVATARAREANIAASHVVTASPPTAVRKTNTNTARTLAHTLGRMTQTNASTTISTKVGNPAKYARS